VSDELRIRAYETQIAALKVELAAMTKNRDEQAAAANDYYTQRNAAMSTRDAALMELSQARAELEATKRRRDDLLQQTRTADKAHNEANARAETAEAQLVTFREMDDARVRGLDDHAVGKTHYDNPWAHSSPIEGHKADAWDTGWFLAAGNKARSEVRQLREENARLRGDIDRHAAQRSHWSNVVGKSVGEKLKLVALLGRAVAALQEAKKWMGERVMDLDDDHYGRFRAAVATVDAILTDSAGQAALDAWRAQQEERAELEAVYQAAKLQRDNWSWNPFDAAEVNRELSCALASAVSKVAARRGGGR